MKLLVVIAFLLHLLQSVVLAHSIEITTGSGANEGIVDKSNKFLKDGSLIQVIRTKNGKISSPDKYGNPTRGDVLLGSKVVGYNFPFHPNQGKFDLQISVGSGQTLFVRAWNDDDDEYGDSELYRVKGKAGEYWNINGRKNTAAFVVKQKAGSLEKRNEK